ncbi:MAG: DUF4149 domain-containing protein [Armatimonadetes bacterium]|nr:DUF4149 domain-containing protein [Armatimonadota bacterium]
MSKFPFALAAARFVTFLALSLWIGGMAFFGLMAAPVLFRIARLNGVGAIAPQMVGAMLSRFGVLTTICAFVLLLCWLIDGALSNATKSRLWRAQGIISLLCLGFSLFLNNVLLPQTQREQVEILPLIARAERGEVLSPAEQEKRAAFDAGHKSYQRLASLNLWLLLALLAIATARGVPRRAENSFV